MLLKLISSPQLVPEGGTAPDAPLRATSARPLMRSGFSGTGLKTSAAATNATAFRGYKWRGESDGVMPAHDPFTRPW